MGELLKEQNNAYMPVPLQKRFYNSPVTRKDILVNLCLLQRK